MANPRTPVPTAVAAAVLFAADRTCCVCREKGKPVQIHHIDEDPTNHARTNLAVVCFDCHEKTQIKGGFARGLDSEQIRLYRDDWDRMVAGNRTTSLDESISRTPMMDAGSVGGLDASLATALVEIDRDAENWVGLAYLYNRLGNDELRDKAIEKAISAGVSIEVMLGLRAIQGRLSEVDQGVIADHLSKAEQDGRYREQASLHVDLGDHRAGAEAYIRGLTETMDDFSVFTVAHHLNELVSMNVIDGMFVEALEKAADEDDLWWQVRSLEELGWTPELRGFVLANEERIEQDPDLEEEQRVSLRMIAAEAKSDRAAYKKAREEQEKIDAGIDWNS
jgi:hypothetical protein